SVTDDLATANAAKAWLEANYLTEAGGFAHVCRLDEQGTRRVD
ncbi:MAG: homoserine kinase, partial [Shewanella sp.]